MRVDFTYQFRGDYIHIQHSDNFEITPDTTEEMWEELAEICEKHKCRRVLAEAVIPKRRMNMMNAYKSGNDASQISPTISLACCFHGYKPDEITEFFKLVAGNRGVRIEFFSSREEALQWLGAGQFTEIKSIFEGNIEREIR